MRKILHILTPILFGGALHAQSIVTDIPQYTAAVLEEYTGIHCQYCPDGHRLAKDFKAAYPGRVLLVNVHTGGYAVPSGNEPDFRTPYGAALAAQTGLTGYPSGTINREVFPEFGSTMALSRSNWQPAGEKMLEKASPVNIGATTSYDANSRTLTIDLEALYTQDAANTGYNLLNIALLQDSIPGPQTGASTYNPGDVLPNGQYLHAHMLRDLITGQWGDTISNTTKGSLFTKTYTYTLPDSVNSIPVNPSQCHLAIYVTETKSDITQGISVDVVNGSNDGNNAPIYASISNLPDRIQDGAAGTSGSFNFDLTSTLSGSEDYHFDLETDAPSDWSASYKVDGTSYTGSNVISLTGSTNNTMELEVIPGATAALAKYTLRVYPDFDSTNVLEQEFYVLSGVTDLIVNGSGGFGDGNTYNWDQVYESALSNAGSNTYDLTSAPIMAEALNTGAFSSVNHIYLNIAWTFPSFSDDEANALMDFMDNGGNVFVAGQDIGWDINASGGYGTAVTRALYTGYFKANYQSDGSTANSQLTADTSDNLFGGVPPSGIVDKYSGNMYPDVIIPRTDAQSVFYYNNTQSLTSSAGIRYADGYKLVYLGIGLEMIQDMAVKNQVMDITHDWFHGMISTAEFDFAAQGFQVYPNPGNGNFEIKLPVKGDYQYRVTDATGKLLLQSSFSSASGTERVDLSHLPKGMYLLNLSFGNQSSSKKLLIE